MRHNLACMFVALILTTTAHAEDRDAQALANRIDKHISRQWQKEKVQPAPAATDAEFLRRAYLDIAGRIPSVFEARTFLADKRPDKRARLIQKLLESSRYVTQFVNVWRAWMLPETDADFQARFFNSSFVQWLQVQVRENVAYDKMVRELLTTPLTPGSQRGLEFAIGRTGQKPTPRAFYQAKQMKPENLAAATSRLFLGIRLECAQCHDHPFATWEQEQFWSYAAFFAGLQAPRRTGAPRPVPVNNGKRSIAIPGTKKIAQASFIDGSKPDWKEKKDPREALADWMTRRNNPYFAKATVNRLWSYFFGRGIVEPVDEMVGSAHEASHPELLEDLAASFIANGYDIKFLIRAITNSKAYQLSSRKTHSSQEAPELFARMRPRGLTGQQIYDSILEATRYVGPAGRAPVSPQQDLMRKFPNEAGGTDVQTSILQALSLMNGQIVTQATSLKNSQTLSALIENPFMTTEDRVEAIYLAILSRMPEEKEMQRMKTFMASAVEKSDNKDMATKEALADIFWALLNSSEFILNH